MDIVNFWEQQIQIWQDEQKCGLCWSFDAPLFDSAINIAQSEAETKCCVHIFLTNISFKETNNYNNTTGLNTGKFCEWSFNIYALIPSSLGQNNYKEIKGYTTDLSKWVTIYKPISDCLSCDSILDFCRILSKQVTITSKSSVMVENWMDKNYSGWKNTYTFRLTS